MVEAVRVTDAARRIRAPRCGGDQTQLMLKMDEWGLTHVTHYNQNELAATVYYRPSDNICDLCVVPWRPGGPSSRNVWSRSNPAVLQSVAQWLTQHQASCGYVPLRHDTCGVECSPNGGSKNTSQDIATWCDTDRCCCRFSNDNKP